MLSGWCLLACIELWFVFSWIDERVPKDFMRQPLGLLLSRNLQDLSATESKFDFSIPS